MITGRTEPGTAGKSRRDRWMRRFSQPAVIAGRISAIIAVARDRRFRELTDGRPLMGGQPVRDAAMTALILGFFASCWFGWAQERPPAAWRSPLIAGTALSLAVSVTGAVLAWRHWSGASALSQPGAMRQYGIIVGVEFGVAAAGAAAMIFSGRSHYLAPWICLVVGVHFFPMAPVLKSPPLLVLGAVLIAVAAAAVLICKGRHLAPSAVTGAGAGVALLGYASVSIIAVIT